MKKIILLPFLVFSAVNVLLAQIDLSKYRLVFNGKEIKMKDVDSLVKIYPRVNFSKDETTSPPTLYIIPFSNEQQIQEKKKKDSVEAYWKAAKIPSFSIKDINGKTISSSAIKGKLVIMNFYFTSCDPCLREIPELNKLVKEYSNRSDIVFLAFALDKKDAVKKFLAKHPFSYTQVPDAEKLTKNLFGIDAWPTHFIIDRDGKVQYFTQGFGENTISDLSRKIKQMQNIKFKM